MPENKSKIDPSREYKKSDLEGMDEENESQVSRQFQDIDEGEGDQQVSRGGSVDTEDQGKPDKADEGDLEPDLDDDDDEVTSRSPRLQE